MQTHTGFELENVDQPMKLHSHNATHTRQVMLISNSANNYKVSSPSSLPTVESVFQTQHQEEQHTKAHLATPIGTLVDACRCVNHLVVSSGIDIGPISGSCTFHAPLCNDTRPSNRQSNIQDPFANPIDPNLFLSSRSIPF